MTAETPPPLPGLDPGWSRHVAVTHADGGKRLWHVLDNGVADPVGTLLCVHGNPTWSYLWRRLVVAAPPGWRVVAPDQLGMGWSERLLAPRTLAQRVTDLGDLTDQLGITGPVVTVAHDWGGIISLGWALEHREQVRGVVLTNTAVAMPEGDLGPALIRLAHAPGLRTAVTVASDVFVRGATALSWPPLPREVRRAYRVPYRSAARRRAVGEFVADIPFRQGHPSRAAQEAIAEGIRGLDVPALLLWGPRDPVFGEKYLADLRGRLPRAEVHRYEGAAHLLPEDAPQYADAVAAWVTDLPAPGGPAREPARSAEDPPPLWSALDDRADDDAPAVVEVGGATVSWRQLARRVGDLAAGLSASGVRPGDRVALLLEPSADLTAAVYAVWRAGAVIVVADKGLGFAGMRRALRGAAPDHVLGGLPGLAAARAMRLPGSRIGAGPMGPALRRALGVRSDLTGLEALGRSASAPSAPEPDADCAVVFTSGATGPAKGVAYTHRQVGAQLDLVRSTYRLGPEDALVAAFAPFSILGPGLGIASAVPDVDVTAPGTLTAAELADAAEAVGATVVFASPAALRHVAATASDVPPDRRAALGRIRLLMSAGAPVPAALLRSLRDVLPAAEAHTPYGMTEVLPVTDVTLAEIDAAGPGEGVCVGRPVDGVEVRFSPLDDLGAADGPLTGEPGVVGEVCVRAPHRKDRYDGLWATERAASRDPGWHRTGDVGSLDADGRLWIHGRLAHVITTADGVVTPVGVELRVEALDGVSAAAVVGVGPVGTQVVVVVVVPEEGSAGSRPALAPGELADRVRGAAGVPVAAVLVTGRLPVDIRHQSKVDRRELARRATRVLSGTPLRRHRGPRDVRVLVTGASGLLGRVTAQRLLARGDDVTVLQRRSSGLPCAEVLGDVADGAVVRRAADGQDAVLHLAAKVDVTGRCAEYERVNIGGTRNVLAACSAAGVPRLVHVSSPSVAHAGVPLFGAGADPADPDGARGHYSRSKAVAEREVLAADSPALAVLAVRPHLVWGPGDEQLVARIVARARSGRLPLIGSGAALIDTTYVDNAADALVAAVDACGPVHGEALVVSNGEPRPVRDILAALCRSAGAPEPHVHVPTGVAWLAGAAVDGFWAVTGRRSTPPLTRFLAEQLSTAHWFDQRRTREPCGGDPTSGSTRGSRGLADWYAGVGSRG